MRDALPVEMLIGRLAKLGPNSDKETLDSILARREEALPYLVQMATDKEYWELDKGYSVWTPISAMHLLSVIGGRQALEPVERAIRTYYDDTGDWLTEDMPSVLAAFGPEAFDLLAGMVRDAKLDDFVRSGGARALLMISRSNEDVRRKSIELLREVVSKESSRHVRTLLVDTLIEFKDAESLEFVKPFFDTGMIDTGFLTYRDVLRVYAGEYDDLRHDIPKDPMEIFSPDTPNIYRMTVEPSARPIHQPIERLGPVSNDRLKMLPRTSKKTGRNDPCPCGSGKKYKMCCLRKEMGL